MPLRQPRRSWATRQPRIPDSCGERDHNTQLGGMSHGFQEKVMHLMIKSCGIKYRHSPCSGDQKQHTPLLKWLAKPLSYWVLFLSKSGHMNLAFLATFWPSFNSLEAHSSSQLTCCLVVRTSTVCGRCELVGLNHLRLKGELNPYVHHPDIVIWPVGISLPVPSSSPA